jgi:ankyrin repeat protein
MTYTPPLLDWIQNCFDPISITDLRALEADLGLCFPEDFRAFLLSYNAGHCRSLLSFPARFPLSHFSGGYLDHVMGIVCDERWSCCDIRQTLAWFRHYNLIPSGIIPVASAFGDPLCMGSQDDNYGKIFYWDQHRDEPNLFLVADSFTDFLSSLTPDPDLEDYLEDLPIFQAVERGNRPELEAYLADGGEVDCRNAQGQTLLMCALRSRWPKLAKLLVDHGASLETVDRDDRTPLYHAAMHQSLDGVKLLLAAGASPSWCDERGMTLVKLTWEHAYYRVSEFLEQNIDGS